MPDPATAGKRIRSPRHGTGLRWRAEWTEITGQRRKKSFTTKAAAVVHLADVGVKVAEGSYISPDRSKVPVAELWERYFASKNVIRPSSRSVYESAWNAHLSRRWGRVPVGLVTKGDFDQWIGTHTYRAPVRDPITGDRTYIDRPISGSIARRLTQVLRRVLDLAVEERRIGRNPLVKVELPQSRPKERVPLTDEQVRALAAAMSPHDLEVWLLVRTGMRWGEMVALRVGDLDVTRRRLRIQRGLIEAYGQTYIVPTKTGKARDVPVSGNLLVRLSRAAEGRDPDDTLLAGPSADGWNKNLWRYRWGKAIKRAGLPAGTGTHVLRHTAASWAIRAGADIKTLQNMLGHAKAAMTLDLYGHFMDSALDDVADRLALIFDGNVD